VCETFHYSLIVTFVGDNGESRKTPKNGDYSRRKGRQMVAVSGDYMVAVNGDYSDRNIQSPFLGYYSCRKRRSQRL